MSVDYGQLYKDMVDTGMQPHQAMGIIERKRREGYLTSGPIFGGIDWEKKAGDMLSRAANIMPPTSTPPPGMLMSPEEAMNMLRMRMRWNGYYKGFIYINAIVCSEKAHVIIITQDQKQVVLEDDPNLFPSDTLVTSIRMIAP